MAMFDPTNKTAEQCAEFLFRWNARGILTRWWAARSGGTTPARMRELAGDVLNLLLDYEGRPHPYVRAQLGTALRLSRTNEARDYDEVVRLARQDLGLASA